MLRNLIELTLPKRTQGESNVFCRCVIHNTNVVTIDTILEMFHVERI